MATIMELVAEITMRANMTDADKTQEIADLLGLATSAPTAGTTAAPSAPSTPSVAAPVPTPSAPANPTLASLVAAYAQMVPPAGTPDVGNPAGIPNFNASDAVYTFYTAGPKAIPAIFTGPGLLRAVFNAALYVQEHGPAIVSGGLPVSPAVVGAVAAYVTAHPNEVPVGNSDPSTIIVGDTAPVGGTPRVLTPADIAAANAFDANIAAQDAGKGSVPISSITAQDLQYAGAVLGDQFGAFLRSYTSDSNTTINQTINAYSVGGPQAAPSNAVPTGSAKITAAVGAFKAANVPTSR